MVADIDRNLSIQLAEILHHPEFQRLEASWRGLRYLVDQTETSENLKIRVLNVTKRELLNDFEKASQIDHSALFKQVYEGMYCCLGSWGHYGLLVGDYEFGRNPEDIQLLTWISQLGAFAHTPFVAAAAPKMFSLDRFTELLVPRNLAKIFEGVEYTAWRSSRPGLAGTTRTVLLPQPDGPMKAVMVLRRIVKFVSRTALVRRFAPLRARGAVGGCHSRQERSRRCFHRNEVTSK